MFQQCHVPADPSQAALAGQVTYAMRLSEPSSPLRKNWHAVELETTALQLSISSASAALAIAAEADILRL